MILDVTLNGVTRPVVFREFPSQPGRATSDLVFTGRCGRTGTKRWAADMTAWKQPDGSWRLDFTFYRLNRNTGRIIGWADQLPWNAKH